MPKLKNFAGKNRNVKLIARGAEAIVSRKQMFGLPVVVKERVKKGYRNPELDARLRRDRTRQEAIILHAAKDFGVKCPIMYSASEYEIIMSDVRGELLYDLLKKKSAEEVETAVELVGKNLAGLHSADMAHGDFTTSNVIVDHSRVWLIDFGLGSFSTDIEEKAIDVLLMKRSLGSDKLFRAFSKGYGEYKNAAKVIKQVGEIEKRGRYVSERKQKDTRRG